MSRRGLLGLGAAGAATVVGAGTAYGREVVEGTTTAPAPAPAAAVVRAAAPAAAVRAISMAMHVHGSFSEGKGCMLGHLTQAREHGIDVIWWTDHDFRLMASGYRKAIGFEGLEESEDGLSLSWRPSTDGPARTASGDFVSDTHAPSEPGRALRMKVTGEQDGWGVARWTARAQNFTYTTSLAQTVLYLDVRPETINRNAQLLIEITSSVRPATGGRPAGRYVLQYRMGGVSGHTLEQRGLLGVVSIAAPKGTWTRITMDLEADVARLWPDLVAADSGLSQLTVAVRARRGTEASVLVDRLRFVRRGRTSSSAALGLRGAAMDAYAEQFPQVRQHVGTELSMVRHMNAFGSGLRLPDYGSGRPRLNTSLEAARDMVRFAQSNGCLVQLNHPLGYGSPETLAREWIETDALGADAVEIGVRGDIQGGIDAFDAAARNAVFVTATGVSDDHNGTDWLSGQRWVTSVWAESTDEPDLFTALRGGRAWFWDPALWRGEMELVSELSSAMGSATVTAADSVTVRYVGTAPPPGGSLVAVTGVVDNAGVSAPGSNGVRTRLTHAGGGATHVLDTSSGNGAWMRVEVRDRQGAIVGFSNPIWLLRQAPTGGVPALRKA